jgi:hypothetical protein
MDELGVDMAKAVRDREKIKDLTCPVCGVVSVANGKWPLKTIKSHIARKKDGEHLAWRVKYWGIHFCKNGWATRSKEQQFRHLLRALRREFGQDMIEAIKAAG